MDELFELEEKLVDEIPVSQKQKRRLLFSMDIVVNVLIIVILVYTVRTFFISPFQVFGPSMCDTLNYISDTCQHEFGEYLIVNKAIYQNFFGFRYRLPKRGDIIVFKPPHSDSEFYIKRIIGEPGEEVEIKKGKVIIYNEENPDGFEIPETYLNPSNKDQTSLFSSAAKKFKVTEGHFFTMGDNRRESTDSRTCFLPPLSKKCQTVEDYLLPAERIEGKALVILWPFSKIRVLSNPNYALAAQ
ncbi:MAG: Signal peptidase I [Candidatus Peregrinibacteria bacterium GW2011_GWA2_47_7]|nr:MAG: Signal peptidase I [Candidatus Peregrinibacteria bacterium GW2011_GWA2_47_7]